VTESKEFDAIIDQIKTSNSFVISTHISPDSDAIGSSVGLALALISMNKTATVYLPEKLSSKFESLVPKGIIFKGTEEELKILLKSSTFIGVDCATKKRLGEVIYNNFALALNTLNIDHHASNENWGAYNWIADTTAATAVMISRIIESLDLSCDPVMSNLLYAGILDDTGSFRYSNTNVEALEYAADLVQSGASPSAISQILYFEIPERVLKLRAKCLNTLETLCEGKISLLFVTNEMLNEFSCEAEDTEGLVDQARSIQGVKVAFFLREIDGGFKVSARAKDETVDVNQFAAQFGGGGHKAASGFSLNMDLENALSTIRSQSIKIFA
jgi:phosphoesterase RecJ-like protein